MTGVISTLVEAWQELRINKVRILLALMGVALSVAALTSVVGVGNLAREGYKVQSERNGGRVATLALSVNGPTPPDPAKIEKVYQGIQQRYGITTSTHMGQTQAGFQFPRGVTPVSMTIVDIGYGTIHRVPLLQGSWFAADDGQRLAPAVVVSEAFYNQAGRPNLTTHPTVTISGDQPATAVIIGVVPDVYPDMPPAAFILTEGAAMTGMQPQMSEFKLWVGEEQADALTAAITADLQGQFPGYYAQANRVDYAAWGDPLAPVQLVVGGVAGLVLLLGAVGMLNISMVTVRYRVREIGIRRSFGATSGRIFVGVMMESVVATAVAGIAGVMLAVAVVKHPWIESKVAPGLTEYPAFPIDAALLGFGAAVLVGALAGAIPALVAVRVKVIDAIRF
ncbi:FtsX-like permease family protein [Paenarthrobacter nitroguajacolicus]|uniref:ABC transporter permease n=1 Tax=Paenarthrobacter nitroguajacolicus TaxID=211146 RepID=UPI00285E656C|nr:FtsX-like permease family protein [Paenarthrobacter nitroguajacolicus]MDR6637456.1 putative ABC transport system permease protein [Paenarthrobacter nitroguajacolicus]